MMECVRCLFALVVEGSLMARRHFIASFFLSSVVLCALSAGCSSSRQAAISHRDVVPQADPVVEAPYSPPSPADEESELLLPVSHWESANGDSHSSTSTQALTELEAIASASNPAVLRLEQQVQAAWAKTGHVDRLPDPTVGANVFVTPIETAAGSQRANLSVSQMIPWLERLDAKSQQACYEAMVVQQALNAERLRVVADVRTAWIRLYVLGKQTETNKANQQLLKSLIDVATARVATGVAAQGDVLLGTLEISRLEEQLISYQQQIESTKAVLNRVAGREASHAVSIPESLEVELPEWSYESLVQIASVNQPAIEAARL